MKSCCEKTIEDVLRIIGEVVQDTIDEQESGLVDTSELDKVFKIRDKVSQLTD